MPITPKVKEFLEEKRFAVLATINKDGSPQQSIVWYELQADHIVMNTKRGRRKERNLRRNPIASICIDDGYRYLAIGGSVTLIDDQSVAQADIERLATRYHGSEIAAGQMESQFSKEHRVTVLLSLDRVDAYGFSS